MLDVIYECSLIILDGGYFSRVSKSIFERCQLFFGISYVIIGLNYLNSICFQYICENHFQRLNSRSMFTGLKAVNHFGRPDMPSFLKFVQKKHSYVSTFLSLSLMLLRYDKIFVHINAAESLLSLGD